MTGSATFALRRASPADAFGRSPRLCQLAALNKVKQMGYWWNDPCYAKLGYVAVVAEGQSHVIGF